MSRDGPKAGAAHEAAVQHFLDVALGELQAVAAALEPADVRCAAEAIRAAEAEAGRVQVTGIGKSEHVARYGAALLSSTGTPAAFLHATEATHGSVGQVRPADVVIALSNSGQTPELLDAVEALAGFGARIVAVTGERESALARRADCVLSARVAREGGPLELAPRASVLAQTLVLQALSVSLQAGRDFTREDYHRRHPAGALGRKSARP